MNLGHASVSFKEAEFVRLERRILAEFSKRITRVKNALKTKAAKAIKNLLREALFANQTVQSILGGELQGHFGIAEPDRTISYIIEELIKEVHVRVEDSHSEMGGIKSRGLSVELDVFLASYEQIIGLDVATTHTNEEPLRWLKNLLMDGSKVIVRGWRIEFGKFNKSRSGQAIMVPRNMDRTGIWRVPFEYAGTSEKNFITDVIDETQASIEELLLATVEDAWI